jgi:phage FluMu gp28-like protein
MKAHFEDMTITIVKDADVMDDLRALQINSRGVPCIPQGKTDQGKARHGDSAVACCMLIAATQMEGGEIDFTPLPSKSDRWQEHDDKDDEITFEKGCF